MRLVLKDIVQTFSSNVNKNFNAIENVSLEINQGEFIGIIGPTGAGKTTLIEHFNALLIPTQGEVEFHYDWQALDSKTQTITVSPVVKVVKKSWKRIKNVNQIRKKVGIVFQFAEYQLFEETIEKDIIFGPVNIGIPKAKAKEIAKEIIEVVGLNQEYLSRSPFELSGGQKRRVALAGILAMKPDFLVFDEPTAGLDPAGAKDMLNLFKKINESGTTVIIVTHNLDDVLEYTSRTIFIEKGKIVKDGATLEVLSDIELLKQKEMQPPKLVSITNLINQKYQLNIPYVKSMTELAEIINKIKADKKRGNNAN